MLEGADGMWISYDNGFARSSRPYTVGDNPICCKIAAADDISCAGGGNGAASVLKKGLFIAVGHKFGAGFTVGIGVIAVQIVTFPVAVFPLFIFINLIRGDV